MNRPRIGFGIITVALASALMLLNVESPRCESAPPGLNSAQSQARSRDLKIESSRDQEAREDRSERFQVLELVIKQSLLRQYEKMEIHEDLELDLD